MADGRASLAVWLAIGPIGWVGVLVGLPVWTALPSVLLVRPAGTAAGAASHGMIA